MLVCLLTAINSCHQCYNDYISFLNAYSVCLTHMFSTVAVVFGIGSGEKMEKHLLEVYKAVTLACAFVSIW